MRQESILPVLSCRHKRAQPIKFKRHSRLIWGTECAAPLPHDVRRPSNTGLPERFWERYFLTLAERRELRETVE